MNLTAEGDLPEFDPLIKITPAQVKTNPNGVFIYNATTSKNGLSRIKSGKILIPAILFLKYDTILLKIETHLNGSVLLSGPKRYHTCFAQ